jgi:hypothetical protein
MLPAVRAAYPNGDFATALNAFQHATSMSQLDALFGNPADPAKLQAMTVGNTLDLFVFIPAYGLFMLAGAALLGGGLRQPLAWLAAAPALIGIAGDIVETWSQLRVTESWEHASAALPLVAPGCWTKFFGIALHALGCSVIALVGARKRWVIAALGALPILAVFADALRVLPAPALMTGAFGLFWLVLMALGFIEAFRARGASG